MGKLYSMNYDELNEHIGHNIELNDIWDWNTNRQIGIEVRCKDCDTEPLFDQYETPMGGGEKVTREQAIEMLRTDSIPKDCYLMNYEYGKEDNTDEDAEEDWTGLTTDDYETIRDFDEYQNFELWSR